MTKFVSNARHPDGKLCLGGFDHSPASVQFGLIWVPRVRHDRSLSSVLGLDARESQIRVYGGRGSLVHFAFECGTTHKQWEYLETRNHFSLFCTLSSSKAAPIYFLDPLSTCNFHTHSSKCRLTLILWVMLTLFLLVVVLLLASPQEDWQKPTQR